jgi:hypothetical protein
MPRERTSKQHSYLGSDYRFKSTDLGVGPRTASSTAHSFLASRCVYTFQKFLCFVLTPAFDSKIRVGERDLPVEAGLCHFNSGKKLTRNLSRMIGMLKFRVSPIPEHPWRS